MIRIFRRLSDVPPSLLRFWEECSTRQDPAMALARSPGWFDLMTHGGRHDSFILALHDSESRWSLVLPVVIADWCAAGAVGGKTLFRSTMLTARVCGGDLITRDVTTQAIHEILQAMKAHRPDIRALLLDHVPEGPRVEALQSCSTAKGVTCYALFRALPHYRLALPEQLEACLGLRSGKSLRRLESKGRALERALGGTLRLVEIKNEQQVAAYADRIQTLMGATWQARLLGHTLHVSDMVDAATRGILRSFMLMADETPIAFALCYQGCGTLMYEQPGFDPRYRKYSPGALLLYRMIEAVYRQDPPRYIDYGEGEARYKGEMANEIIHASAFIVHQGGLRERAVFLALALTRWLDRAVRAAVKATPLGRRWIQSLKH